MEGNRSMIVDNSCKSSFSKFKHKFRLMLYVWTVDDVVAVNTTKTHSNVPTFSITEVPI